mmetsp:Transcript_17138/g.36299  ORF Transcript_17138/g.36299 Transcript_17138/m.36299 type:complete len:237 (-) Transcript_17138:182-892(-)
MSCPGSIPSQWCRLASCAPRKRTAARSPAALQPMSCPGSTPCRQCWLASCALRASAALRSRTALRVPVAQSRPAARSRPAGVRPPPTRCSGRKRHPPAMHLWSIGSSAAKRLAPAECKPQAPTQLATAKQHRFPAAASKLVPALAVASRRCSAEHAQPPQPAGSDPAQTAVPPRPLQPKPPSLPRPASRPPRCCAGGADAHHPWPAAPTGSDRRRPAVRSCRRRLQTQGHPPPSRR